MKHAIKILTILIGLTCALQAQPAANASSSSGTQSQEVKFAGHGVELAGTLLLPKLEAGKRAPAVLIIVGSGPTPRDGLTFGTAKQLIYRDLAEALTARGYITLRYDKRCVGASQCRKPDSFDDYTDDAKGGLEFLRKHERVDARRIFLLGHSEGGYIASTVAANDDKGVAGVVLVATAGRTLTKLMREQLQNRMTEAGKPAAETNAFLAKYDRIVAQGLTHGQTSFPTEKLDANDPYDALLLSLINQQQIIMGLLINDPLQIVPNIKAPVLILQGRKDMQVAVKDAQYLEEAMKRAHHPDTTMTLLDDADHLMKTNTGAASLASYADATRPLDAKLLATVTDWLAQKSKAAGASEKASAR